MSESKDDRKSGADPDDDAKGVGEANEPEEAEPEEAEAEEAEPEEAEPEEAEPEEAEPEEAEQGSGAETSGERSETAGDEDAASRSKVGEKAEDKKGSGTLIGILGFLIALGLGFGLGQLFKGDSADVALEQGERYLVQLRGDEPQKGPDDALVTIIEFADYQCPYCAKATGPLNAIADKYDEDVRVIYKHMPLPMHRAALPAAKAAWAAHQQGKFWPMHEHLFETKGSLDTAMEEAKRLGMDVDKFAADIETEAAGQAIDDDIKAAGMLGIRGTPTFVVNGHIYAGHKGLQDWEQIVEHELEIAEDVVDSGVPRDKVFAELMKKAQVKRQDAPANKGAEGGPDPSVNYQVPIEGRPALGPDDALVTIVEFSDFQCPYCSRVAPTAKQLVEKHDDVRLVFRNLPLPNHPRARPAAKAALAAARQGRFWEMHDKLFERRASLGTIDLSQLAEEVGLDVAQFERDAKDPALEQMIEEDEQLASRLGVQSTPTLFVNGRHIRGAQSISVYETVIEEERRKARALIDEGTPRERVYDELMASAKTQVEQN